MKIVVAILMFITLKVAHAESVLINGLLFALTFSVIIWCAIAVAHHAEELAVKYGEPYGTMILTLSAVAIEVILLAVMMAGANNPTLARDTIYSALMLDINGILGVAAIIGGMKYKEQSYNFDSSNSYITMLCVAIGVCMIVPEFLSSAHWKLYSGYCIVMTVAMYGVFLWFQTSKKHYSYFFTHKEMDAEDLEADTEINAWKHALFLFTFLVAVGLLSEGMEHSLNVVSEASHMPKAVIGILIAIISASSELLTAFRASWKNNMQAVVNIALGASVATVLLTIPCIEIISLMTDKDIIMGLTPVQTVMTLLTLFVAMVTLQDGETNAIEGMAHFALFTAFVMLSFIF